jgi:hypothetical protein
MGNSQAAECSITFACMHDVMAVQRYIRQVFQRKSPNLSRIDVTRTFCAKGYMCDIYGKSFRRRRLTSSDFATYIVVSSRSLHSLITAVVSCGLARLCDCVNLIKVRYYLSEISSCDECTQMNAYFSLSIKFDGDRVMPLIWST